MDKTPKIPIAIQNFMAEQINEYSEGSEDAGKLLMAGMLLMYTRDQKEISSLTSQLEEFKETRNTYNKLNDRLSEQLREKNAHLEEVRKERDEVNSGLVSALRRNCDLSDTLEDAISVIEKINPGNERIKLLRDWMEEEADNPSIAIKERDQAREEAATYRKALDDAKYELSEILAIGYMANVKRNAMKVINDALAKYPTNNPNTKTE